MKSALSALLLMCAAAFDASAQTGIMLQRDTNFAPVSDCPIEAPFTPEPDRSKSTQAQNSLTFSMNGHALKRIQFSGQTKPLDLEIIWTPVDTFWPIKTAHLSVGANSLECFVNWFFAPNNTPTKQIEVRALEPLSGLSVSFSDRIWDHEGDCPAKQLCPVLMQNMHQCTTRPGSKSCDVFIDTARRLTPRHQCRREFDHSPVPAIWVCDEMMKSSVLQDMMHLLKRMKTKSARQFYRSSEFRSVLDGALAEAYADDPLR